MEVRELGEFGLIARIEAAIARAGGGGRGRSGRSFSWIVGPGDDAAVLRPHPGHDLVVSTDAFVEGVHFRFDHESARTAGRRAMAAALSDLAAMGARPRGFTLSMSLPPATSVSRVMQLVRGLLATATPLDCPLVGGNLTRSHGLELHLTVLGEARSGRLLRRSGAQPGDRLFVSGPLGRSALERRRGRVRHVPEPRIRLGQALARRQDVSACIDLSDGLVSDLGHLCEASGVGARVDLDAVPRPPRFEVACRRLRCSAEALLLGGGEDYELLFAVRGSARGLRRLGDRPLAEVGVFTRSGLVFEGAGGRALPPAGWRHF